MTLLLKQRWTRQPQYNTGIDWGNPLTRGLVFAVTPNMSTHPITVVGAKRIVTQAGVMFGLNATLGTASSDWVTTNLPVAAEKTIVVCAYNRTNANGTLLSRGNAPYSNESLYLNGDQLTVQKRYDTTYKDTRWDLQIFASQKIVNLVVTQSPSNPSTPDVAWKNGVRLTHTTFTAGVGTPIDADIDSYIGNSFSGGNCWDGGIAFIALIGRVVSDAEAASLSQNPWQLFKPGVS